MAKLKSAVESFEFVIENIPLDMIVVGNQKVRVDENDPGIIELANSIVARTLLQPIGVSRLPEGNYQLRWGLRRLTAHRRLRWQSIYARIYPLGSEPIEALALIENITQQPMTLEEECHAIAALNAEENMSPSAICDLLGKSRAWVNMRLALPNLSSSLQDAVYSGRIALGAAEEISTLPDEGLQESAIIQTIQSDLTVVQVGQLVEAFKSAPNISEAVEQGASYLPGGINYQEPTYACQACSQQVKQSELVFVRIHKDGCPPEEIKEPPRNDPPQEV